MLNQTLEAHKKQKQQSKQLKSQIQEHQNTTLSYHETITNHCHHQLCFRCSRPYGTLRGSQQHNEQNNEDITLYSSLWHDTPPHPVEYPGEDNIINFAVRFHCIFGPRWRCKRLFQAILSSKTISMMDHYDSTHMGCLSSTMATFHRHGKILNY